MSIAAAVILYLPDEQVIDNISTYSPYVKRTYVIDNSENSDAGLADRIRSVPGCVYIHDGRNMGIAFRLNQVCALAAQEHHSLLLTMDQDSAFMSTDIKAYLACIGSIEQKERIAVYGVEYEKKPSLLVCSPVEVPDLITSGSVVNLDHIGSIGGFDENLFIDGVDHEYCWRAREVGYKIIQFANIYLSHNLGETVQKSPIAMLGKTQRVLHSPVRLYYMTRNFLYLKSKYKSDFREEIARTRQGLYNRIKNNLIYNDRRLSVLRHIIGAVMDYKRHRMGKL